MRSYGQLLKEPVDLNHLLESLDISDETLGSAALTQARLYMEASRFYVNAVRSAARGKAQLEERRAFRAQYFRKKGEKKTEGQIKELVSLSPSVQRLQKNLDLAQAKAEYGRLLLEALKMRRDAIRILTEVMGDESRAELRIMAERKSRKKMEEVRNRLNRKYPKGGDEV